MALVRWENPLRELATMEVDRLNHMFSNLYGEGLSRAWMPVVDIYNTPQHEVVIKAELPDVKREDISVTFENNVLTLKGERKRGESATREHFQRVERSFGSFTRSFTLPTSVDASKIAASYKDGVLTVRLPRREESKPKQISVNID
jgi:HSP20 family protein